MAPKVLYRLGKKVVIVDYLLVVGVADISLVSIGICSIGVADIAWYQHGHYTTSVRDITWIGVIECALHQVEVGTCTSDTWSLD